MLRLPTKPSLWYGTYDKVALSEPLFGLLLGFSTLTKYFSENEYRRHIDE